MKIRYESEKWNEYADLIDRLLEEPCHLIDLYPVRVPEKSRGEYYAINDWILDKEYEDLAARFFHILLKLNCYCELTLYLGSHLKKKPSPDLLRKWVFKCFHAKQNKRKYMNIFVDQGRAMLVLDGDSPCLAVYKADEVLQELLKMLAASEGMFFRSAPG